MCCAMMCCAVCWCCAPVQAIRLGGGVQLLRLRLLSCLSAPSSRASTHTTRADRSEWRSCWHSSSDQQQQQQRRQRARKAGAGQGWVGGWLGVEGASRAGGLVASCHAAQLLLAWAASGLGSWWQLFGGSSNGAGAERLEPGHAAAACGWWRLSSRAGGCRVCVCCGRGAGSSSRSAAAEGRGMCVVESSDSSCNRGSECADSAAVVSAVSMMELLQAASGGSHGR